MSNFTTIVIGVVFIGLGLNGGLMSRHERARRDIGIPAVQNLIRVVLVAFGCFAVVDGLVGLL